MILPSFGTDRPLIPLDIDPPSLTPYRQILLPFFTPQKMDALLPRTHELARELLDAVEGQEVFDAAPYCRMLPAMVFGEYCGFPMEDAAQFDVWRRHRVRPPATGRRPPGPPRGLRPLPRPLPAPPLAH
jgi:cytochrome P450